MKRYIKKVSANEYFKPFSFPEKRNVQFLTKTVAVL